MRPLIVTNDNEAAIKWAYEGADTDKHNLPSLIGGSEERVTYKKGNLADIYNKNKR